MEDVLKPMKVKQVIGYKERKSFNDLMKSLPTVCNKTFDKIETEKYNHARN